MGVMACDRAECPNIMCDRYSKDFGYICADCFEELVSRGVHKSIAVFMVTPRRKVLSDEESPREYFGSIFKMKGD